MECRTCLSWLESAALNRISESAIEQIWECAGVRASPDESMCAQCGERLRIAHEFRRLCRRSDEWLRRREKIEIKVEPMDAVAVEMGRPDHKREAKCEFATNEAENELRVVPPPLKAAKKRKENSKEAEDASAKPHACPDCPYRARARYLLERHARTHSGERPYECARCPMRFAQLASLSKHASTHSRDRPHACPRCPKRFKRSDQLLQHARNVHKVLAAGRRLKPPPPPPFFECDACGKRLASKLSIRAHLRRHADVRDFSCETCAAAFLTRSELASHLARHVAARDFACDLCEFRTHRKKSLEMHLLRHAGDKSFACADCERRFFTRVELVAHRPKHTREKNFACDACGAAFGHRRSVTRHRRKVHGVAFDARGRAREARGGPPRGSAERPGGP